MDLGLKDKLALISGSTKGIGFAIARTLAAEGARVLVNGRTDSSVTEALASLRAAVPDAEVEGFAADLATAEGASEIIRRYPSVDILVNSLGIYEPQPFEEISDDEWRRFFEINVLSAVRLSRAYLSGYEITQLGAACLHKQRERHTDSGGNGPLRHE